MSATSHHRSIGWRVALVVTAFTLAVGGGLVTFLVQGVVAMGSAAVNPDDVSTTGVLVAVGPPQAAGGDRCTLEFTYLVDGVEQRTTDTDPQPPEACDTAVGEAIPLRIDADSGRVSHDPAPFFERYFTWIERAWAVVAGLAILGAVGIALLVSAVSHNRAVGAPRGEPLPPMSPAVFEGQGKGPASS